MTASIVSQHSRIPEYEWNWPVNTISVNLIGEAKPFWLVWCGKTESCWCKLKIVGTGMSEDKALMAWRFLHFESEYLPKNSYLKEVKDGHKRKKYV